MLSFNSSFYLFIVCVDLISSFIFRLGIYLVKEGGEDISTFDTNILFMKKGNNVGIPQCLHSQKVHMFSVFFLPDFLKPL